MLLAKGKITEEMIRMLSSWRHSGFHVFCGNRISPQDETAMENLARYIIRTSFSQERMAYLDHEATVVYTAKDGKDTKVFPALEWLARARPPPKIAYAADDLFPHSSPDAHVYGDPEYSWDDYVQA
jgi:hypothetical protein